MDVDELDAGQALRAFGSLRVERDRADRDIFLLAAHFADLYHAEATPTGLRQRPGAERPVRVAGEGAPLVLEFAIAEMAAELHLTTWSARRLIGDALETRHRLPRLWARVVAGEVAAWLAAKVARATRDLTRAQAGTVDAEVAEYADGRLPYWRFAELLTAKVAAADPDATAERERQAAEECFAKVSRTNDHGQKTLYVKTTAAEMTRIDATITVLADALKTLGDTDHVDVRRAKATLVMANPLQALTLLQALATHKANDPTSSSSGSGSSDSDGSDGDSDEGGVPPGAPGPVDAFLKPFRPTDVPPCACRGGTMPLDWATLLPTAHLYLHVHRDSIDTGTGIARWEGEGPVTLRYIQEFLGPYCRFLVKPVIDPATLAPVDAYEIPDRHREALHLRTPADVFPYAPNTSRRQQADHTKPYRPPDHGGPPGQTGLHNLGPMTTYHHRVKTHAGWHLQQPIPGIYLWTAPHGSIFLVDHTGTRQLRGPTTPDPTASRFTREAMNESDAPSLLETRLGTLLTHAA